MNSRSKYNTKQRELLLDYFKTVSGVHVTAGDVCEYFRSHGAQIGQSTIYRQLESLVDEGIVSKYIIGGNSPACFEYAGADGCKASGVCFHCKCEKCGKVLHLRDEELADIQSHLTADFHFKLDPMRTVFYGLCEKCM